jgi:hypothetical protein
MSTRRSSLGDLVWSWGRAGPRSEGLSLIHSESGVTVRHGDESITIDGPAHTEPKHAQPHPHQRVTTSSVSSASGVRQAHGPCVRSAQASIWPCGEACGGG